MSNISIIGTGNMARTIGERAIAGGNAVEVIGRDQSKAGPSGRRSRRRRNGRGVRRRPGRGHRHRCPAVRRTSVPVVAQYGDALTGKVIIDISNPFNSAADGLAIPDDTSIAQEVAKVAPASASVVKAFNTIFGVCRWPRADRWTSSSPATTRAPRRAWRSSSRASICAHWTSVV